MHEDLARVVDDLEYEVDGAVSLQLEECSTVLFVSVAATLARSFDLFSMRNFVNFPTKSHHLSKREQRLLSIFLSFLPIRNSFWMILQFQQELK